MMANEVMVEAKIELLGILEYMVDPTVNNFISSNLLNPSELEYKKRVNHYFSPFLQHSALLGLKDLFSNGFKSEQAVRLLLYHSQIPYLFSQPMIQNQKHLEWIKQLRLWIDDTKFPLFFENNLALYQHITEAVETSISQIPIFDIIELFFGERKPSYSIFASSIKTGNFNVFLPNKGLAVVLGSPILSSLTLYPRLIHELALGFIKPAIDLYWSLFQKEENTTKKKVDRDLVYDLIAKAVQEFLIPGSIYENSLITSLVESISTEYQAKRNVYPLFSMFIPQLAKFFKEP